MARPINRLTERLSDRLTTTTEEIIENGVESDVGYSKYSESEDDQRMMQLRNPGERSPRVRVKVFSSLPEGRIHSRLDVYYRDDTEEYQRAAVLRDNEENAINITYQDTDTGREKQTTRRGTDAGQKAGEFVVELLSKLQPNSHNS